MKENLKSYVDHAYKHINAPKTTEKQRTDTLKESQASICTPT
jgi:hypothetical protein